MGLMTVFGNQEGRVNVDLLYVPFENQVKGTEGEGYLWTAMCLCLSSCCVSESLCFLVFSLAWITCQSVSSSSTTGLQ